MKRARDLAQLAAGLALVGVLVLALVVYQRNQLPCPSPCHRLSFETIARYTESIQPGEYRIGQMAAGGGFMAYQGLQPALFVTAKPEDVDGLTKKVLASNRMPSHNYAEELRLFADQLRAFDYNDSFYILALYGMSSPDAEINITQVTRQDNQSDVWAQFKHRPPDAATFGSLASPHHLIKVSKDGIWGEQVHFVLMNGRQPVAETTHFIP